MLYHDEKKPLILILPLPVWAILAQAFRTSWERRAAFFRVAALPMLLLIIMGILPYQNNSGIFLAVNTIANMLVFTVFAVHSHRVILQHEDYVAFSHQLTWGYRETRFLGWSVVIFFGILFIFLLFAALLAGIIAALTGFKSVEFFLLPAAGYAVYVIARLSLLLPAVAIDQPLEMGGAWRSTVGNGLRLMVILVAPTIIPLVIFYFLRHQQEINVAEKMLIMPLNLATCFVGIAALSLSYQYVIRSAKKTSSS